MSRTVYFVDGLKPCSKCKRNLPSVEFHKTTSTLCGYTARCKECRNEACRQWCESNPERRRAAYEGWVKRNPRIRKNSLLRSTYGITIEQYDEMFLKQGGACAICKEPKKLVVDHCHTTGKVRGLLCNFCNTMIGKMQEKAEKFESAISYLKQHKS